MKRIPFTVTITFILLSFYACAEGLNKTAVEEKTKNEPGAPSGLRLKIVSNGFQLNWIQSPQDPGIVTGYEIVRADIFTGPYITVGTVGSGITQYIDRTAQTENIFYYKVRVVAGALYSPYSNTVAGERVP